MRGLVKGCFFREDEYYLSPHLKIINQIYLEEELFRTM